MSLIPERPTMAAKFAFSVCLTPNSLPTLVERLSRNTESRKSKEEGYHNKKIKGLFEDQFHMHHPG